MDRIANREEEIKLLQFAVNEAKYNKELIAALEEYEVEVKSNGEIHKGKEKERIALINRLKKENKIYKKFYQEHNIESSKEGFDYERYRFSKQASRGRDHLFSKDEQEVRNRTIFLRNS